MGEMTFKEFYQKRNKLPWPYTRHEEITVAWVHVMETLDEYLQYRFSDMERRVDSGACHDDGGRYS